MKLIYDHGLLPVFRAASAGGICWCSQVIYCLLNVCWATGEWCCLILFFYFSDGPFVYQISGLYILWKGIWPNNFHFLLFYFFVYKIRCPKYIISYPFGQGGGLTPAIISQVFRHSLIKLWTPIKITKIFRDYNLCKFAAVGKKKIIIRVGDANEFVTWSQGLNLGN